MPQNPNFQNAAPAQPHSYRPSCGTCWVRGICLGDHLPPVIVDKADSLIQRPSPVERGGYLFRAGEPCQGIHVIQSGLVKKLTATPGGGERVLGFYMGGDIVGFEGLDRGFHRFSVQALDTTAACYLSQESLEEIACTVPSLYRRVIHLLANGDYQAVRDNLVLRDSPADVRLIAFLLRLSERFARRRLNDRRLELKVPQRDLANYLGLKRETVSRVFSRLQREELIRFGPRRELNLLDMEGLRARLEGYKDVIMES